MKAIEILFKKVYELATEIQSENNLDVKVQLAREVGRVIEAINAVDKIRYNGSTSMKEFI